MADIPVLLQASPEIFNQNENLKSIRAELDKATAKVISGTVSAKKQFLGLIKETKDLLAVMKAEVEATVIPKDRVTDFNNGDATLTEFADFETVEYYNDLNKLNTIVNGFNTALIDLEDAPPKPIIPQVQAVQAYQDTVSTDEFDNQGYESPVVDIQQGYSYYTVSEGETLQDIAQKLKGDPEFYTEIARANGIVDSEFINDAFVGQQIRIPETANLQARNPSNIVYEKVFDGSADRKVNKFLHGQDIRLHNKKFKLSPSGDLRIVSGPENTKLNIERRFRVSKGALSPRNPSYGVLKVGDYQGDLPLEITIDKIISDYESQAGSDPRVVAAFADIDQLELIKDTLVFPVQVKFMDGTRDTIKANKNLF